VKIVFKPFELSM